MRTQAQTWPTICQWFALGTTRDRETHTARRFALRDRETHTQREVYTRDMGLVAEWTSHVNSSTPPQRMYRSVLTKWSNLHNHWNMLKYYLLSAMNGPSLSFPHEHTVHLVLILISVYLAAWEIVAFVEQIRNQKLLASLSLLQLHLNTISRGPHAAGCSSLVPRQLCSEAGGWADNQNVESKTWRLEIRAMSNATWIRKQRSMYYNLEAYIKKQVNKGKDLGMRI